MVSSPLTHVDKVAAMSTTTQGMRATSAIAPAALFVAAAEANGRLRLEIQLVFMLHSCDQYTHFRPSQFAGSEMEIRADIDKIAALAAYYEI